VRYEIAVAKIRVAIVGASGYTGAELARLLLEHPHVELSAMYARRAAGQRLDESFPQFTGRLALTIDAFDADDCARRADVACCALPHGESAPVVVALRERGLVVLDLSADFRLRDAAGWQHWYASAEHPAHPAPGLLAEAVYGLPERHRAALRGATLVAVPGCYPTASILAIAPLLERGLVAARGLVIDAKSGASGAGRQPGAATHLPEAGEGVRPYKVAGGHRHTAELEQELALAAGAAVRLTFSPHLLPMSRGMLACVYAEPTATTPRDSEALRLVLAEAYRAEPFVDVLPAGRLPDTAHVRGSNRAHVTALYDARAERVVCVAAIDNLVKGASGQAVQCLNLALGFDERAGLGAVALFP
jgi:N-acetyl-gamma-glutamyl-phosphate reductase